MDNAMADGTITIDKAGRVVLPTGLRDRFCLRAGSRLAVVTAEDHFQLRPIDFESPLVKVDGWWVHQGVPESELELLDALARHRDERHEDVSR